jgi:hypothetical protein
LGLLLAHDKELLEMLRAAKAKRHLGKREAAAMATGAVAA